jgi:hypothetical protein
VNGGWSGWSSCYVGGGGICLKDRACNNPPPSCGGADCPGSNWTECTPAELGCSNQSCPSNCGYGGGQVNNGTIAPNSCNCGKKTCPAQPPCSSCTISVSNASVKAGQSTTLTANTTATGGTISSVAFTSGSPSYVTVSPASDSTSPYQTAATGVEIGSSVITSVATMNTGITCQTTSTVTVTCPDAPATPTLSCNPVPNQNTVAFILGPAPAPLHVNYYAQFLNTTQSTTCRAWSVTPPGQYNCSGNPGDYFSGDSYAQETYCNAQSGHTTASCRVDVPAWWQVKDSDVITNGDLRSKIASGKYFDENGPGGYPGVPIYGGATNLTSDNVSTPQKWLANSSLVFNRVYDFTYFSNAVPDTASKYTFPSQTTLTTAIIGSAQADANGYKWLMYDGAQHANQNLTTAAAGVNVGDNKVILIVKGVSLNISGNITLNDGVGFFLAVSDQDISVDKSVGGGTDPNLEGIYVADQTFHTGTGYPGANDSRLWLRGTIASYGESGGTGIDLQRNLGIDANLTTPAEYFEYAPDQELLFPVELAFKITNWREIRP